METPDTLPARLFLLSYDPAKERLTARDKLGFLMRAAALAELSYAGHLTEDGAKVSAAADAHLSDPVLAAVLTDMADSGRARRWPYWVQRGSRKFPDLVRDQLVGARVIQAEKRKVMGLFTVQKITLRDPRARQRLADAARRTLRGGEPVERIDQRDAATVALAATAGLNTVADRRQRREFKHRLRALGERSGPAVGALRRAISNQQAVAASAGG